MRLLHRHILGSFLPPFAFGLSVTTMVLMLDVLKKYVELFLEKGVAFPIATEVLLLSLGHTFALSVPMAVLVGVLMGVGTLSSDQEITAMKAGGVSLYRVTLPLLLVGLLMTASMMAYNHWILPESNFRLRGLLLSIHEQRPLLQIEPGTLTDINDRFTIYVRDKDDRTGQLKGVRLYQRDGRGDPAPDVIVARSGHISSVAPGRIRLALQDGEFHRIPNSQEPDTYTRTRFAQQSFWIDMGPTGADALPHQRGERELNVTMLRAAAAEQAAMQAQTRSDSRELLHNSTRPALGPQRTSSGALEEYRNLLSRLERNSRGLEMKATILENHRIRENRYLVELHKKFSIPVACAVFVLLGVPLATGSRRSGKGVSIGLSLVAFTIYYLFLTGGEKLADRGMLDPAASMWAANVVLGGAGIWMLVTSVRENWRFSLGWPRVLSFRFRPAPRS